MPNPTSTATPLGRSAGTPVALPTVEKRDGRLVPFDAERIRLAIEKAFRATQALDAASPLPPDLARTVGAVADEVVGWCAACSAEGVDALGVEQIQDEVERCLMRHEHHVAARRYVLYREARLQARQARRLRYRSAGSRAGASHDGDLRELPEDALRGLAQWACNGLDAAVDAEAVYALARESFYDGMAEGEVRRALTLAARALIEREPDYAYAAARLLLADVYREGVRPTQPLGDLALVADPGAFYRDRFRAYLQTGVDAGRLDERLLHFDLGRLAAALRPERDLRFAYLGLQTLYDRYLLQAEGLRFELPQWLWMRVAMGLALQEEDREDREGRAEAFYGLLSTFRFMCSTPTLFNAGTPYPQLSSCYLTTVQDDLGAIFKGIRDNALLSKWAGGLGNDWTSVRALGAHIRGTNGQSQGVVPFLKVANDAAVAVNQGGKRKGAVCAYLETWHLDVEEFLELRRNTGDERRRTPDMNTANWIPDLFMQRVAENAEWTLFSPDEVPDLHDLTGRAFRTRYQHYERLADEGQIQHWKRVDAVGLWRRMLSMLFETGHPWLTFKDPCNLRSPQDHAGRVHSSNLCTEVVLNTSADETAVCNLGSVNLVAHLRRDDAGRAALDLGRLRETVTTAVRMLDNVIDLNYYPTEEAWNANLRHRPVGLGIMGFQDALYAQELSYASDAAADFADFSQEAVSLYAIGASAALAAERGSYASYAGSKWDRGLFPLDTLALLEVERGEAVPLDRTSRFELEWGGIREAVARHGMRNSNVMAIAPTATIANICGVSQSIEPTYKHLYVKSNLSGEFTQVNTYLVDALKAYRLWDEEVFDDLKYFDGSLSEIDRVPDEIKDRFRTAFEVEPRWLIECAARRQKWIDQAQSLNLYVAQPSGRKLSEMYRLAWRKGLKTTYYLRALAATQVEKSTLDVNRRGLQPRWMKSESASARITVDRSGAPAACTIDDPDCEACQ